MKAKIETMNAKLEMQNESEASNKFATSEVEEGGKMEDKLGEEIEQNE